MLYLHACYKLFFICSNLPCRYKSVATRLLKSSRNKSVRIMPATDITNALIKSSRIARLVCTAYKISQSKDHYKISYIFIL